VLAQKLDAWGPPQHYAVQQVEHTPLASARRASVAIPRMAGRKPSRDGRWRHQPALHVQQKQLAASQSTGARRHSRRPS
jgi:hypothetical protein